MAIAFKPLWAAGMDDGPNIPNNIAGIEVEPEGNKGYVGRAVDTTLANVCAEAQDLEDALDDLEYIIRQLTIARDNIREDADHG